MRTLTRAEEQIMQVLWKLERAFVKEIIEQLPKPKPHYNTVSTIVKILVEKGFVSYTAYGKSHQYYPLVAKNDYAKRTLKNFVKGYFDNSFPTLVTFIIKEKEATPREIDTAIQNMKKPKKAAARKR